MKNIYLYGNELLKYSVDRKRTEKLHEKFENIYKTKDLDLIYEGEDVYIKFLEIPKVKKNLWSNIIKNELIYIFEDITNISYSFEVIDETKEKIKFIIYCINSEKNKILKEKIRPKTIKRIRLIQFVIMKYFENKVKENSYILVFEFNSILYLMFCHNKKLISNKILDESSPSLIENILDIFEERNEYLMKLNGENIENNSNKIYFLNVLPLENIKQKYECIQIENFKEEDLITRL